jgi:hypothetical protein
MSEHKRRASIAAPRGMIRGGRRATRKRLESTHRRNGAPVVYSVLGGESMRVDRPRVPWMNNLAAPVTDEHRRRQERRNRDVLNLRWFST